MKLPAFKGLDLSKIINFQGDQGTLTMSRKKWKILGLVGAIILLLAIIMTVWGIARQAEVVQLRQQTQLQTEQLKLSLKGLNKERRHKGAANLRPQSLRAVMIQIRN